MKMIKTFSKSTLTSVVSLACGLVMYSAMKNSKPSLQNHANAVTDVVENVVDDIFQNRIVIPEQSVKMADYISNKVIPKAMDKILNGKIDLTDCLIFNFGTVTNEKGNEEIVSIGIFGEVFTFNEEAIKNGIEDDVNQDIDQYIENHD